MQHRHVVNPPVLTALSSRRVKPGDVLVSRPTARADVYDVSVVPAASHATHLRYEHGMDAGRQLARSLGVDGWFTCDHTHFMPIVERPNPDARRSGDFRWWRWPGRGNQ